MSDTDEGSDRNTSPESNKSNTTYVSPTRTPRVSLPVRFSNPHNPESERLVAEISVDHIFIEQTDQVINSNENFLQNINRTLTEVDRVLNNTNHSLQINILDQTIPMANNGTLLKPNTLGDGTSNDTHYDITTNSTQPQANPPELLSRQGKPLIQLGWKPL